MSNKLQNLLLIKKLKLNNIESVENRNHKQNVKDYNSLKEALMSEKDVLCLEFDFGQNFQLPKIPVSE